MEFKIDLHVHSKYSEDNESEAEEMVIRAIELGLQGIAFTEHYSYAASAPVEALKGKYGDAITIFRGVEFSSADGHCLVFGADTDSLLPRYAPIGDIVRLVSQAGGVVIPSHPYRKGSSLGDLIMSTPGLCAIEGYNGGNMHEYNARAIETARVLNIPYTGGSDAHAPREVGLCYTVFSSVVTEQNLVQLLKSGNYQGIDARRHPVR